MFWKCLTIARVKSTMVSCCALLLGCVLAAASPATARRPQTPPAQTPPAQAPLRVPDGLPAWAFNIPDAVQPPGIRPEGVVRVPGSSKEYDAAKIAGNANPPDWFPDDHPPAPRSVAGGPGITTACGSCHLMSGQGHSESADIAGMPAEYLIRQMAYYKAGTRKDDARMGPIAKATSEADVREAAEYSRRSSPECS